MFFIIKMNQSNLNVLPEDVLRNIYSFGSVTHRNQTKRICGEINNNHYLLQYNILLIEEDIVKFHNFNNENTLPKNIEPIELLFDYLSVIMSKEKVVKLFKQCNKCYCCNKHCNKRPININEEEVSDTENFGCKCGCKCRQMSRIMKRIYNKNVVNKDAGYYLKRSSINNLFIE